MRIIPLLLTISLAQAQIACSAEDALEPGGLPEGSSSGNPDPTGIGTGDLQCKDAKGGKAYKGFGGRDLIATRINEGVGVNRGRIKPFPVLYAEFERTLGKMPNDVGVKFLASAPSFDLPPARYYTEPKTSGVSLATYYEVAFTAALAHVNANASKYGASPTQASARTMCTDLARVAWRRRPSESEIATCVDLTTTKVSAESNVQKRWAYGISAILSSADFLTY